MDGCQRHNPTGLGAAGISTGMESTFAVKIMDLATLPDLCPVPPGSPGTALSLYVYWQGEIHFTNGVKNRSEGEGGGRWNYQFILNQDLSQEERIKAPPVASSNSLFSCREYHRALLHNHPSTRRGF